MESITLLDSHRTHGREERLHSFLSDARAAESKPVSRSFLYSKYRIVFLPLIIRSLFRIAPSAFENSSEEGDDQVDSFKVEDDGIVITQLSIAILQSIRQLISFNYGEKTPSMEAYIFPVEYNGTDRVGVSQRGSVSLGDILTGDIERIRMQVVETMHAVECDFVKGLTQIDNGRLKYSSRLEEVVEEGLHYLESAGGNFDDHCNIIVLITDGAIYMPWDFLEYDRLAMKIRRSDVKINVIAVGCADEEADDGACTPLGIVPELDSLRLLAMVGRGSLYRFPGFFHSLRSVTSNREHFVYSLLVYTLPEGRYVAPMLEVINTPYISQTVQIQERSGFRTNPFIRKQHVRKEIFIPDIRSLLDIRAREGFLLIESRMSPQGNRFRLAYPCSPFSLLEYEVTEVLTGIANLGRQPFGRKVNVDINICASVEFLYYLEMEISRGDPLSHVRRANNLSHSRSYSGSASRSRFTTDIGDIGRNAVPIVVYSMLEMVRSVQESDRTLISLEKMMLSTVTSLAFNNLWGDFCSDTMQRSLWERWFDRYEIQFVLARAKGKSHSKCFADEASAAQSHSIADSRRWDSLMRLLKDDVSNVMGTDIFLKTFPLKKSDGGETHTLCFIVLRTGKHIASMRLYCFMGRPGASFWNDVVERYKRILFTNGFRVLGFKIAAKQITGVVKEPGLHLCLHEIVKFVWPSYRASTILKAASDAFLWLLIVAGCVVVAQNELPDRILVQLVKELLSNESEGTDRRSNPLVVNVDFSADEGTAKLIVTMFADSTISPQTAIRIAKTLQSRVNWSISAFACWFGILNSIERPLPEQLSSLGLGPLFDMKILYNLQLGAAEDVELKFPGATSQNFHESMVRLVKERLHGYEIPPIEALYSNGNAPSLVHSFGKQVSVFLRTYQGSHRSEDTINIAVLSPDFVDKNEESDIMIVKTFTLSYRSCGLLQNEKSEYFKIDTGTPPMEIHRHERENSGVNLDNIDPDDGGGFPDEFIADMEIEHCEDGPFKVNAHKKDKANSFKNSARSFSSLLKYLGSLAFSIASFSVEQPEEAGATAIDETILRHLFKFCLVDVRKCRINVSLLVRCMIPVLEFYKAMEKSQDGLVGSGVLKDMAAAFADRFAGFFFNEKDSDFHGEDSSYLYLKKGSRGVLQVFSVQFAVAGGKADVISEAPTFHLIGEVIRAVIEERRSEIVIVVRSIGSHGEDVAEEVLEPQSTARELITSIESSIRGFLYVSIARFQRCSPLIEENVTHIRDSLCCLSGIGIVPPRSSWWGLEYREMKEWVLKKLFPQYAESAVSDISLSGSSSYAILTCRVSFPFVSSSDGARRFFRRLYVALTGRSGVGKRWRRVADNYVYTEASSDRKAGIHDDSDASTTALLFRDLDYWIHPPTFLHSIAEDELAASVAERAAELSPSTYEHSTDALRPGVITVKPSARSFLFDFDEIDRDIEILPQSDKSTGRTEFTLPFWLLVDTGGFEREGSQQGANVTEDSEDFSSSEGEIMFQMLVSSEGENSFGSLQEFEETPAFHLLRSSCAAVEGLANSVNQRLLLSSLLASKKASALLIAQNSTDDGSGDESVDVVDQTFKPGQFQCELIERIVVPLHLRCATHVALWSVEKYLSRFQVLNRKGYFVLGIPRSTRHGDVAIVYASLSSSEKSAETDYSESRDRFVFLDIYGEPERRTTMVNAFLSGELPHNLRTTVAGVTLSVIVTSLSRAAFSTLSADDILFLSGGSLFPPLIDDGAPIPSVNVLKHAANTSYSDSDVFWRLLSRKFSSRSVEENESGGALSAALLGTLSQKFVPLRDALSGSDVLRPFISSRAFLIFSSSSPAGKGGSDDFQGEDGGSSAGRSSAAVRAKLAGYADRISAHSKAIQYSCGIFSVELLRRTGKPVKTGTDGANIGEIQGKIQIGSSSKVLSEGESTSSEVSPPAHKLSSSSSIADLVFSSNVEIDDVEDTDTGEVFDAKEMKLSSENDVKTRLEEADFLGFERCTMANGTSRKSKQREGGAFMVVEDILSDMKSELNEARALNDDEEACFILRASFRGRSQNLESSLVDLVQDSLKSAIIAYNIEYRLPLPLHIGRNVPVDVIDRILGVLKVASLHKYKSEDMQSPVQNLQFEIEKGRLHPCQFHNFVGILAENLVKLTGLAHTDSYVLEQGEEDMTGVQKSPSVYGSGTPKFSELATIIECDECKKTRKRNSGREWPMSTLVVISRQKIDDKRIELLQTGLETEKSPFWNPRHEIVDGCEVESPQPLTGSPSGVFLLEKERGEVEKVERNSFIVILAELDGLSAFMYNLKYGSAVANLVKDLVIKTPLELSTAHERAQAERRRHGEPSLSLRLIEGCVEEVLSGKVRGVESLELLLSCMWDSHIRSEVFEQYEMSTIDWGLLFMYLADRSSVFRGRVRRIKSNKSIHFICFGTNESAENSLRNAILRVQITQTTLQHSEFAGSQFLSKRNCQFSYHGASRGVLVASTILGIYVAHGVQEKDNVAKDLATHFTTEVSRWLFYNILRKSDYKAPQE